MSEKNVSVSEFKKKYDVPSSTVYDILNKKIVRQRLVTTKYGKRKKFNEDEMVKTLRDRMILADEPEPISSAQSEQIAHPILS
jgi:predicted transcriptional regulator